MMNKLKQIKLRDYCLHFVNKLSFFNFIYKNMRIKIYGIIILLVVLYGWET
jgi:hypothetical protein